MESLEINLIPGILKDMLNKRAKLPIYLQVLRIVEIGQKFFKIELSDSSCIFNGVGTKTATYKSSINYNLSPKCLIQVNLYDILSSKNGNDKIITLEKFLVICPQTKIIGDPKWISSFNEPSDENPTSFSDNHSNESVQVLNEMEKSARESIYPQNQNNFQGSQTVLRSVDKSEQLVKMNNHYDWRLNKLERQMQELKAIMQKLIDKLK